MRGGRARRRLALAVMLGLLAACHRHDRLPAEMTIEHVVSELAPPLAAGTTVEGPPDQAGLRVVLQPGDRAGGGAPRDAVAAPPGTTLRFRVDVPEGALLRFSAGVEGDKHRDTARSGIEFRVLVDGHEAFSESINPAQTRHDRRWVDGEVDLRALAGKTADVVLETKAEDPDRQLAGTAGWSRVRLLTEERRTRQLAGAGPNVLVLLVDTLRADRLGIYGADPSLSPALDRFAARGLVFDVAVAQASWTMPAVASIFTGLHPRSHGAVGPDVHDEADLAGGSLLPDRLVTLAEIAQEAGVTTFGISTNLLVSHATNLAQGFEDFIELPFDQKRRDYAPAAAVNRRFLDWLHTARGLRFFAYLHYMEPHGPYAPPARFRPESPAAMRGDLAAGWVQDYARALNARQATPPSPAEVAHLRHLYDGDVQSWDEEFGALLEGLTKEGVLGGTIVVVIADHGEEFLEHGNLTHGGHLYEETVHIPLVIAGPGIPAERRQDLAQGIDVLPTLAAQLGATAPPGLPGRDLVATRTLAGPVISEIVSGFGDEGKGRGAVAIRNGRWKLIRGETPESAELYDLASDPGEQRNLAGTEVAAGLLAAEVDRWAAAAPSPPKTTAYDPKLREKLKQLGYVD